MNPTFPRPPRDVLNQFFPSQPASIDLIAPGLSGARVWRVQEVDHHPTSWALRKWPAGTSAARVQEIDLLVQRALDHEFPFFPALRMTRNRNRRLTDANQCVWECRQWMPGHPPRDDVDTLLKCGAQLASASARFSLSTGEQRRRTLELQLQPPTRSKTVAEFPSDQQERSGIVTSLVNRLHRLQFLRRRMRKCEAQWRQAAMVHPLFADDPHALELIQILRAWFSDHSDSALRDLEPHTTVRYPIVSTLGDLHVKNALFAQGRLSGIVDTDAIRLDNPTSEMARLIGSLELDWPGAWEEDSDQIWKQILAAYRQVRPFSDQEEDLARTLVQWTPGITLANWLFWLLDERRQFDVEGALLKRRILGWGRIVQSRLPTF